jgi:DNA polymerase I-like protein with 3'-5' exonuclease and polymerase domains
MEVLFGIENVGCLDKAEVVAFDVETTGLVPVVGGLRLLQLTALEQPVVVIDLWELSKDEWADLRGWCSKQRRVWVAHNAVFDLGWLQEHRVELNGDVRCTMLASRLTSNGLPNLRHGLAPVLERHMQIAISKEEQRSDWSAPLLTESQVTYAARDVYELIRLYYVLLSKIQKGKLSAAYAMECAALPVLAHMQRSGLPFSRQKLEELQAYYEERIETLGKEFVEQLDAALTDEDKLPRDEDGSYNLRAKASGSIRAGTKVEAGFNLNSPKQLLDKFALLLGEAPVDEKTGKGSVSVSALRGYSADHTVVQTYLGWKKAEKRRQMVVALMKHQHADGFIRASYMQLGADTGRMSCRNPNLQQVPRDKGFRAAAEAPDGWSFVVADFGQMELRLAAAVSKDKRMTKAFQDGEDLHTITAAAIYPEPTEDSAELKLRRQVAKSANFGLLYGSGAKGLRGYAGAMGITMTLDEADAIRSTFRNTYLGIANWQSLNADEANRTYGDKWAEVRIPGSELRRYLPGELNRLTTRCNTPIQGAGAAVLKVALADLWPYLRQAGEDTVKLAAVVHDEVVLLVREGQEEHWAKLLSEVMETAEAKWLGDIPPLAEAAWGKTWADAK